MFLFRFLWEYIWFVCDFWSARIASPAMSAYTASKHAFGAFSDSLRMEMAMFDIKVLFARLMF